MIGSPSPSPRARSLPASPRRWCCACSRRVRLQLAGLALLAVLLPLLAVLLSGWVMFHMGDDVKILAVAAASAPGRSRRGARARRLDRAPRSNGSASPRRARRGRSRQPARPRRARASWPSSAARSTRWPPSLESLFDARRELVARGEPRPPHADRVDRGDARGDRGRPRRRQTSTWRPLQEQARRLAASSTTSSSSPGSTPARSRSSSKSVALAPLVESCLRGFEAEARARNVPLERRSSTTRPQARCAPEQVERVLLNLLTNALRHTPSDGTVAVAVAARPDARARSRSRTPARGSRRTRRAGCSTASGAATRPAGERRRRARPRDRARARRGPGRHASGPSRANRRRASLLSRFRAPAADAPAALVKASAR